MMIVNAKTSLLGRKSGLVGSELDSRSKGRGFESNPKLDGNSVKAIPGSTPVPNPGTNEKKNKGNKMDNRGKMLFKSIFS